MPSQPLQPSRSKRRIWTSQMNSDLLECKIKAKEITSSENPPREPSGRKKGYMKVMKELWDTKGYANLNLSSQNLRDQAASIEKSLGNVGEAIRNNVGQEVQESTSQNEREEHVNTGNNLEENLHTNSTFEENLHNTPTSEVPVESGLNNEAQKIAHKAKIIYTSIRAV